MALLPWLSNDRSRTCRRSLLWGRSIIEYFIALRLGVLIAWAALGKVTSEFESRHISVGHFPVLWRPVSSSLARCYAPMWGRRSGFEVSHESLEIARIWPMVALTWVDDLEGNKTTLRLAMNNPRFVEHWAFTITYIAEWVATVPSLPGLWIAYRLIYELIREIFNARPPDCPIEACTYNEMRTVGGQVCGIISVTEQLWHWTASIGPSWCSKFAWHFSRYCCL